MNCPECGKPLERAQEGGVALDRCPDCGSLWVLNDSFKHLKDARDRFVRWLDPDLWSDVARHEIGETGKACPGCGGKLHEVRYADSEIAIDICPACRGVWLHRGEIEKIVAYLERIADTRTVGEYVKSLSRETAGMLAHQERIMSELKTLEILMKLIEYRIISRFPAISRIAAKLPPL